MIFMLCLSLLYPYREIEQPVITLQENVCVMQCSPARTGSTLIFNVLHYLFEEKLADHESLNKKVIKTHDTKQYHELINKDVYVVATIRDPLDSLGSVLRFNLLAKSKQQIDKCLNHLIHEYNSIYEMRKKMPQNRFLILRYEQFSNDQFDYVFDELETFFSVKISEKEKESIVSFFCLESMKETSKQYHHYVQCNHVTGLHGNHINQQSWKEVIPKEYHEYVKDRLKDIRDQWKYM